MRTDRRITDIINENKRLILVGVTIIYFLIVLDITLIDRTVGVRRHMLEPMWEIRQLLRSRRYGFWLSQIVGNCVMLMSMGFFLPALSRRFRSVRCTTAAGFAFSLWIELTQYITGRGLCELDDIIHNTFGAAVGVILFILLDFCKRKGYYYGSL